MTAYITLQRVSPNCTIQDSGRPGVLGYGLSASGPMDRRAYRRGLEILGLPRNFAVIEFGATGMDFTFHGKSTEFAVAADGFLFSVNKTRQSTNRVTALEHGDQVQITPGSSDVYGYVAFSAKIDVPEVLGSFSTNVAATLGGLDGRALEAGDVLHLQPCRVTAQSGNISSRTASIDTNAPVRVLPGLHADLLGPDIWHALFDAPFRISTAMNRMGVRLIDSMKRFDISQYKSLVSDAVVPGDIQILGDGTPVILMRDHQPVGGYPRLATVIDADQDRVAQMRPDEEIRFQAVGLKTAREACRGG